MANSYDGDLYLWRGRGQGGDPGAAHTHGSGAVAADSAQLATSKIPPYWEPRLERMGYPFRVWGQDIAIWAPGTELAANRQGPAIVQRLGGGARALAREIPAQVLADGQPVNGVMHTGVELVLNALNRRYGQAGVETAISATVELQSYRRLPNESIDDALGRFELLKMRAEDNGFAMAVPGLAWQLLNALNVPKASWPMVLMPFNGELPQDNGELIRLMAQLRRQAHIAEHTLSGPRDLSEGWREPGATGHFYGDSEASGASFGHDAAGSAVGAAGASFYGYGGHNPASGEYGPSYIAWDDDWPYCSTCECYLYDDYTPTTTRTSGAMTSRNRKYRTWTTRSGSTTWARLKERPRTAYVTRFCSLNVVFVIS